jgi:hypothetical protein
MMKNLEIFARVMIDIWVCRCYNGITGRYHTLLFPAICGTIFVAEIAGHK